MKFQKEHRLNDQQTLLVLATHDQPEQSLRKQGERKVCFFDKTHDDRWAQYRGVMRSW